MKFLHFLNMLILGPLEYIFSVIYIQAYQVTRDYGLAIVALSLMMNLLVLPLYRRADALQAEEAAIEKKLAAGVAHIKKTFTGDERMMILQTYYRQNHYKPTYVLRSSISLFLEIPFFITAYHYLSNLEVLKGASFGPIADLGSPDGLLTVAGLTINLLPFVMTGVNLISCVIFTKDASRNTKIQLYAMALFFLVFLYNSPAGLLFYWTLNNLFSLVKTVFYKLKNPKKALRILMSLAGFGLIGILLIKFTVNRLIVFGGTAVILQLPLLLSFRRSPEKNNQKKRTSPNTRLFFASGLFLALFVGGMIPMGVISSSPQEFVNMRNMVNPVLFARESFLLAAGLFVAWMGVFYFLTGKENRALFENVLLCFCGGAIVCYFFFGLNLGVMDTELVFDSIPVHTGKERLLNLVALFAVWVLVWCLARYQRKAMAGIMTVLCIATGGLCLYQGAGVTNEIRRIQESADKHANGTESIPLSRNGQNVIVLMLDRGMGEYVPFLMEERPELKDQFDGFTYYSNTISHGAYTVYGSPGIFGGYEYIPDQSNLRDTVPLREKQNEALKLMPAVFAENGYQVTFFDPVYANYGWIPDLSIFDDIPNVQAYNTKSMFGDKNTAPDSALRGNRFFRYAMMKIVPLSIQNNFYHQGDYCQFIESSSFQQAFQILKELRKMTQIQENLEQSLVIMTNDATHDVIRLLPDYETAATGDLKSWDPGLPERMELGEKTLALENTEQISHFQCNMAAFIQLGKWFDYLREEGIYDNTRIILVADHGRGMAQCENTQWEEEGIALDAYMPLLMVKDFGAAGFRESTEFMTNADTPTLAFSGLIEDPVNPFTGKQINSDLKNSQAQYVLVSQWWDVGDQPEMVFAPGDWISVHDDIHDLSNWALVAKNTTNPRG